MTSPFIRKRPRRYCRGQYKGEGPRLRAQSHADELRFNCRRLRFGQLPAQFGFQYLAVIVLRQGLYKAVLARPLEARDMIEAELVERGFRHLSFRLRDNKRDDLLSPIRVRPPDDRGLDDIGMAQQHLLDLARIDVAAARNDHV